MESRHWIVFVIHTLVLSIIVHYDGWFSSLKLIIGYGIIWIVILGVLILTDKPKEDSKNGKL
ncbi:hypothetical protein CEW46_21170 [Bacillus cereus]|nr:hypothetical protein CEW46_21170 [Bacillus cereus]